MSLHARKRRLESRDDFVYGSYCRDRDVDYSMSATVFQQIDSFPSSIEDVRRYLDEVCIAGHSARSQAACKRLTAIEHQSIFTHSWDSLPSLSLP